MYLDTNKLDEAEAILDKLLKKDPNNNFYLDAASDLYIAQKQPEKAAELMKEVLTVKPNNPVITINYANALLKGEKIQRRDSSSPALHPRAP